MAMAAVCFRKWLGNKDFWKITRCFHSVKTGRYYAVQDFGRPKSKAIAFKITNESDATMHYRMDGQSFSIDPHYTMTHQRCRAGELDFQEAHGKGDAAKDGSFHPRNGERFVIRGSREGGYTVEVQ
jgi:hypothetical protein